MMPNVHQAVTVDPEIEMLIPDDDVNDPELSIVVPAMNERITIEEFVEWCKMGLSKAGIMGPVCTGPLVSARSGAFMSCGEISNCCQLAQMASVSPRPIVPPDSAA
jgi:hypothetical protein